MTPRPTIRTTVNGRSFVIHEPGGVHLTSASDGYLAELIVRRLVSDGVIAAR